MPVADPSNPKNPYRVEIALPLNIFQLYSYLSPVDLMPGCRVIVPFGPQRLQGVCLSSQAHIDEGSTTAKAFEKKSYQLKAIDTIVDTEAFFSANMLKLAEWLSNYYCHPIGDVLRSMAPSSQSKTRTTSFIRLVDEPAELVEAFGGRNRLGKATLKKKITPQTLQSWLKQGLIATEESKQIRSRIAGGSSTRPNATDTITKKDLPKNLTAEQMSVLADLKSSDKSRPQLLHGVTGAGKTEIYMRLIEDARQVLILVPEISLTPQMTDVFTKRFGQEVEVVHSAMSASLRFSALERIRSREARILIGPRSALFAPFCELDLIVVDEEHDSSYKQSSGFCYNARDAAIVRARIEGAMIVLGSATPSMESIHNAKSGKYDYHTLTKPVFHHNPPLVHVLKSPQKMAHKISSQTFSHSENAEIIHPEIITSLKEVLDKSEQAMILINRRGQAFYVLSVSQNKSLSCPHCSVSLSVHGSYRWLRCHYCEYSLSIDELLKKHGEDDIFFAVGHGSEYICEYLQQQLPSARIARLDADVLENRKELDRILSAYRKHEIDILVGTQILAKGHDFPDVTCVAILDADDMLQLPDFRAGERCFQLIVQASGRVGRAGKASKILIQTLQENHPIIHAACQKDYASFSQRELGFRRNAAFPPYVRIAKIEMKSPEETKLDELCKHIQAWLEQLAQKDPTLPQNIKLYGPSSAPIETIRGQHRRMLLLKSKDKHTLNRFIRMFQSVYTTWNKKVKIHVDIDPQSLL